MLAKCSLLCYAGHYGASSSSTAQALVLYDPDFPKGKAIQTLTAVDGRRGDKEGWAFWYVGSPVLHPTQGTPFAFAGAARGFEELPG